MVRRSREGVEFAGARIDLDGVCVDLDGHRILSDVSLSLDQHRIAVIGANGSGKSTFARLLNGLVRPAGGSVRVHGVDAVAHPEAVRAEVGFVFSSPDAQILLPTPAEDIALSLRDRGTRSRDRSTAKAEIAARTAQALAAHGLAEHADQPAYSLSGGQKQLLALASVLVTGPRLVVADEPTTLLDLGNARRIVRLLIEEIPAQAVVVTHDLDLAARCDVAVLFAEGRIADVGEPASVIAGYRRRFP